MLFCYFKDGICYRLEAGSNRFIPVCLTLDEYRNLLEDPACPYLLGIWFDADRSEFQIFRDFFGKIPFFFFHRQEEFLCFSTSYAELIEIVRELQYPLTVNHRTIKKYLAQWYPNSRYSSETFLLEIKAALPGHLTKIPAGRAVSSEYIIRLSSRKYEHLDSLEQYGLRFREYFTGSVLRAIEGRRSVASQLSGGVDSSSVVCVALHFRKDLNLYGIHLQSELPEDPELLKRHDFSYAHDVARHTGVQLVEVPSPGRNLGLTLELVRQIGQPPMMIGITKLREMLLVVKSLGCEVMLTGSFGDSVVGFGKGYTDTLWNSKDWSRLNACLEELAGTDNFYEYRHSGKSMADTFYYTKVQFLRRKATEALKVGNITELLYVLGEGCSRLNVVPARVVRELGKKIATKLEIKGKKLKSIVLASEGERQEEEVPAEKVPLFADIQVNQSVRLLEDNHYIGNYSGVKIEHPYFDLPLYELCESVPEEFKFYHGLGRGQQREGLKGILTESVRLRSNKTSPDSGVINDWFEEVYSEFYNELLTESQAVWRYIDREAFLYNCKMFRQRVLTTRETYIAYYNLQRVVLLAAWLKVYKL